MAQRDREIGGTQPQKFLPHVERVAVLGRKASRRGDAFDIGEQENSGGERKQLVEFQEPKGRHGKTRQPLRYLSGDGNAQRR